MFLSSIKPNTENHSAHSSLLWLIRLRWCAVIGQAFTCLLASFILKLHLPYSLLAGFIAITASSNGILEFLKTRTENHSQRLCGLVLIWDTVILTAMLYWSGGHHNPFTAFYLLHVTLGAILLPNFWVWCLVVGCALSYLILFLSPSCIHSIQDSSDGFDLHLHGMWVALVLVSGFIAYFVQKLSAALVQRDRELHESRLQTVRLERFTSLATLAAGVAHEIATPLSTIAVVSADLSQRACERCKDLECKADATLIRQEVDRCRYILERLSLEATRGTGEAQEKITCEEIPSLIKPYLKSKHFVQTKFYVEELTHPFLVPRHSFLQTLAALIKNSCEASLEQHEVRVIFRSENQGLLIQVRDDGAGMTDEMLSRIGEPFFTTKEPGSGMGLGLFLVRMFSEQMGGTLHIESRLNSGTEVKLWLPLVALS